MTTHVISADSHVALDHARVRDHLATRFHDAYDEASAEHERRVSAGKAASNLGEHWYRPGHFDGAAHLADMDIDGLDVEVVYCEVSGFRYLYRLREGAVEATRAFNDALTEYASPDPDRLVVSYQIPIHDIDAAVAEVRRVADAGGRSLQIPVFPNELGFPDYHDARYDPLWATVQEVDLPLCCHIGMNALFDDLARRDPTPGRAICVPMIALSSAEALGMWILGGVFARFPGLRLVLVEPGIGWVAWWLDQVDEMTLRHGYEYPALDALPSEYFRRNVFLTFMDEARGVRVARDRFGVENLLWASDYPHPPTTWPNSHSRLDAQLAGLSAEERASITGGNAARVWRLANDARPQASPTTS
jgi:predicted TIM-barrel fold metal-dependent hydrolase